MSRRFGVIVIVVIGVAGTCLAIAGYVLSPRAVELGLRFRRATLERALPEHDTFTTSRGTVHRYAGGEGDTLVLIHGFGDSAAGWSRVARALSEHYRVVVLDLAGHGLSDPVKPPLGFDDLVEGVEAALADQGNGLLLIGNSLGGWMAMRFALDHPDRVHRVLLLNSGGASWADVPDALLLPSTREEQRIKIVAMFGPDNTPRVPDFMLDQLVARGQDPRLLSLWNEIAHGMHLDDELAELRTPVELLWGTPDPFLPLEAYAKPLLEALPNAELHTLDGCGHASQYSCPQQLTELVLEVSGPEHRAAH